MRRVLAALLLLALALGIGAAGYRLGLRTAAMSPKIAVITPQPASGALAQAGSERKILYYKDPMGKPDYSPVPKKDSMGMDYIPVYEGDEEGAQLQPAPASAAPARASKGKILYYRNPMGLPDTSPAPKKDSMGMDYIAVYVGEEPDEAGAVKINPAKVQELGVQIVPAEERQLTRTIRAVGTVQADERRLHIVNTKFEGWIEKLYVNATGQPVRRGDPLMEVYAPELVVAEREYLLALQALGSMARAGAGPRGAATQLAEASLQRLRNWDIPDDQLKRLQHSGAITRTLTLQAPTDGIVLEKMAVEGMRFMPGEPLYRIADLSSVWLIAEVFEQDIGALREGQDAKIAVNAYPGTTFNGTVAFVYPTVSQETRTGKVRIVVPNPGLRLKTGMYANVALNIGAADHPLVAVPDSAVIDSGTKQAVLVERGEGMFQPREVKLGAHADGFYEIREGLAAGERVVVSANFLIDAESNLKAAFKAFAPPAAASREQRKPAPAAPGGKP
jgi:Cu(I)/Ag(I) efflux system membrane fusion protein